MPTIPTDPVLSLLELATGECPAISGPLGDYFVILDRGPRILRISYYPISGRLIFLGGDAGEPQFLYRGEAEGAGAASLMAPLQAALAWLRGSEPAESWRDRPPLL